MVSLWLDRLPRCSALVLAAALGCGTAAAEDVPRAVAGLRHDSADAAQKQLRERGYRLTASDASTGKTWQYWWHQRDDVCLLVKLGGGRVEGLQSTSETDCAPRGSDPKRLSAEGRVAIGAARALGVESLQHRSHERDERRYGDVGSVAEFERGYRDGLRGARAQQRGVGGAYKDGYRAGENRRPSATRPTPPPLGGAAVPVLRPTDLVGRSARELEPTMRALGYQRWGGFESGRESFSTWRGATPAQCVRAVVRDGRIQAVNDIGEAECM